jgi:hypothetical protein
MPTTSLGFPQPIIGSPNWGQPTNAGWALLNQFLTGALPITGLNVNGNVVISGSLTAGTINGVIPAGLITVPFAANPIFDASKGLEFKLTLTGNVSSSSFINGTLGPSIIAFRIVQDGTGGRTFTWPSNVRDGGVVNPAANARSVQLFAVDTDGSLDSISPMQYS